ncbi:MAG: glucosamine-6-phosphate isomerase [Bryobacteraceae bacterium]
MTNTADPIGLLSTLEGSLVEHFYPAGWDLARIQACCSNPPASAVDRQSWWHPEFRAVPCDTIADCDTFLGHEIAFEILKARRAGRKLALILPVGPMGMYRWTVYFLKEWDIPCDHVYGFNMDEWSDADGRTISPQDKRSFQNAMEHTFYDPLGELTVPEKQRHFPTQAVLPSYTERISELKASGAELIVVFGIGRACHIAFWEPHFGGEFGSDEEWRRQTHRLAAKLHPLTIEQTAILKHRGCITPVPARANTIGPGLFLQADRIIGSASGAFGGGPQWQGMVLWMTLRYGPDRWVPSSFLPTLPGRLFFLKELALGLESA